MLFGSTELCYEQADYIGHDIAEETSGNFKAPGTWQSLIPSLDLHITGMPLRILVAIASRKYDCN